MFELLAPPGTEWDAPIAGEPFVVPPIPGPEVFDLRKPGAPRSLPRAARRMPSSPEPAWDEAVLGSNNWAVAGTHTADGRALFANDMHLGIRVPNTWYRASLAHHPEAVNLGIQGMETARTLEDALAVANRSGIPAQNCVVADETGRIGWTITGRIPRRVGFSGRIPTSWAWGSRRWDGWLAPEEVPRVVDPLSGRIWTANARVVGGEALAKLGDGGYDLGARARQIRDGLFSLEKATPRDLLAIQLARRGALRPHPAVRRLAVEAGGRAAGPPARPEIQELG